jgi:16S rRNA (adenine1518-N6/adenine1519-N6)-dimethyltransferase
MALFQELQDLMISHHFRPEKKLSQFFCINEALLLFLVNKASIKKNDVVLEIGPGTGFLTRKLLDETKKKEAKVIAIELDETMIELLKTKFEREIALGELTLIKGNCLEEDFEKLKINKIVSLPPYHISSDLLAKIALSKGIEKAILVLDKGFSQKLLSFEGLFEYTALSVLVTLNAKVTVLEETVDQISFFPKPNCLSTAIQLDFEPKNNSKEFFVFLRELFRHRNKDLQKALKQSIDFLKKKLSFDEKKFSKKVSSLKTAQKKVYLLSPKEFLEAYEELFRK